MVCRSSKDIIDNGRFANQLGQPRSIKTFKRLGMPADADASRCYPIGKTVTTEFAHFLPVQRETHN